MTNKGLYKKYIVQKADGSEIDPDAKYFVLELTQTNMLKALLAYVNSVKEENPELARDMIKYYKL